MIDSHQSDDSFSGGNDESAGGVALAVPPAATEESGPTQEGQDTPIPECLPILAVRESVAFPGTVMPLDIGREKSKQVLEAAAASDKLICIVAQRNPEVEEPSLDDLHRIGTACRILKMLKMPDDTETVIVHGVVRVGIEQIIREDPYLEARVHPHIDQEESSTELEALAHNLREAADRVIQLSPNVPDDARVVLKNITTMSGLADFLAANLSLNLVHKQELLETFDVSQRMRKVYLALCSQLEVLELSRQLQQQVRDQMDKSQREYYLRQQMKAIQSELGQNDGRNVEMDRLHKMVEEAKMPEAAMEAAQREMERMAVMPQASPEYAIALDYVEWLAALPWVTSTEDNLDIRRAETILDEDHYGLKKIKRRILEFLAVRTLKPDGKGSILCFTGPPGVGKTSLGRSIARALGRKFVRFSLGGMHDEAEIRGHRRTYVGAMPGRIVQNMRKCGSNNPVFMLDEVDKIGQDFRGDPSSALLEVLDPQQNNSFSDHYLDVPFDLSNALFIATANYMEAIPAPLRDRMEIIKLSSYTEREKLQIAKGYLIPRQIEENGLSGKNVTFRDNAVRSIIAGYTREAGVRELERRLGAICRALAASIVRGEAHSPVVDSHQVTAELGHVKFEAEVTSRRNVPGVVVGLAFTPVGGSILFIEVTRMPGRGLLAMTGQVGDVMRESAQAAYSLIRSQARKLGIRYEDIEQYDLHVHVPAGAIPKDGPSAGVAIFCAMVSMIKGVAIDSQTGMTGEITLRGAVLPVGGIKEKVLAAHRAGVKRVILPQRNLRDLEELPKEVTANLHFIGVRTIDEVINCAFTPRASKAKTHTKAKATKKRTASATKRKTTTTKTARSKAPAKKTTARRKTAIAKKSRKAR